MPLDQVGETITNILPAVNNPQIRDSTYVIVSSVAYLIGVPLKIFTNDHEPPKIEIYNKLELNKNARIIRNLCRLRTAVERNFKKIYTRMATERTGIVCMDDLVPSECFWNLSQDGVTIKTFQKLNQYIIEFNKHISNRINNCKEIFPLWLNWDYIKELFIMPNGLSDDGLKKAADGYYTHIMKYPYQVYMNWPVSDEGIILFNDRKFVTRLYKWHNDEFTDMSKVSDAPEITKNTIYDFLEASRKTVLVVDCENSDPYRLCATLRNLDTQFLYKITKLILFDDVHTAPAWRILESHTSIPVEHILIERVKQGKSLVDIRLTAGACKEFYANHVDSFVLVSSDSDYWGLITALPEANFLVMVERDKAGHDIKKALSSYGIYYCYLDDFYTGDSEEIKHIALLTEIKRYLAGHVRLNVFDMMDEIVKLTRVDMSKSERDRFLNKCVKSMTVEIDTEGNVSLRLNRK